jgi:CRP-like cAMP-binding protein
MGPTSDSSDSGLHSARREVRLWLERTGKTRSLRAGEILFEAGEEGNSLYLLQDGAVTIYRYLEENRKEVVGWIRPGEILGELEFLDGGKRSISAEASKDTRALEVSRDTLDDLEREDPALYLEFLSISAALLSERLRMTNDLCKREILRGIDNSGAQVLGLSDVLKDTFEIEVALVGGEQFEGHIVLTTKSEGGYQVTLLESDGHLVCIPYDCISNIRARR